MNVLPDVGGVKMRKIKIIGCGAALPENTVHFGDQNRYRMTKGQNLLDLAEKAVSEALDESGLTINDIDLIIGGMATPLQAIPCNAALIHERVAKGMSIPAFDINSSCTSFITAFDLASYLIDAGTYNYILIVSGDTASAALNPKQKESYELFSDAAAAFIVTRGEGDSAVIGSKQCTWSEGAHDTEIRGGCGLLPAFDMTAENHDDYYFDMKGVRVLKLTAKKLPDFLKSFLDEMDIQLENVDMFIPHQASKALGLIMQKLGIEKDRYIDRVNDWGNMISAAVPMALYTAIREKRIKRGDNVVLFGTAAGLTINILLLKY